MCFFTASDHYVATVTWASDDRLVVQWLKRLQNHLVFQTYKPDGSAWTPEMVKGECYGLITTNNTTKCA